MTAPEILTVTFEPLDVLVFRDYRGFDAGRMHENRTVDPSPSVLYGCLRAALLRSLGADFSSKDTMFGVDPIWRPWLGDRTGPGTLQLRGPFFATGLAKAGALCPFLPAPLDQQKKRPYDHAQIGLRFPSLAPTFSDALLPRLLLDAEASDTKDPEPRDELLTLQGARAWAAQGWLGVSPQDRVNRECIVERETRTGIARDLGTRTARQAMFYMQDTLRFRDGAGLLVEVDAETAEQVALIGALDGHIVPLGGRNHRALLRVRRGEGLPQVDLSPGRARAWCLTPLVIGSAGVQPPSGALDALHSGEPMIIGSFDLALGRPRALQRALPAGTVLELCNVKPPEQTTSGSWGQPPDLARAGFGTVLIAGELP